MNKAQEAKDLLHGNTPIPIDKQIEQLENDNKRLLLELYLLFRKWTKLHGKRRYRDTDYVATLGLFSASLTLRVRRHGFKRYWWLRKIISIQKNPTEIHISGYRLFNNFSPRTSGDYIRRFRKALEDAIYRKQNAKLMVLESQLDVSRDINKAIKW